MKDFVIPMHANPFLPKENHMKPVSHRIIYASLTSAMLAGVLCSLPARADDTPAAAPAADAPTPEWTVPTSISLVSDYIFRGQSQTWGKPAAQLSVEVDHASGLYAGFFASNVSERWLPGATVENDYYGGYRGKIKDTVGYDLDLIYYTYPGANWKHSVFDGYNDSNTLNTAEASVALTYKWLTFKTGTALTEFFGWSTNNSPKTSFNGDSSAGVTGSTRGSSYFELDASYDVVENWNVSGQLGHQIIANATGLDITYYKVGVTRSLPKGWSVGVFYSGSDTPNAYKHFLSLKNGTSESDVATSTVFVNVTKAF
jgi:hypothetical protein